MALNEKGKSTLARLEAAESSGRKLNPEGQRLLGRLRQAGGAAPAQETTPEADAPGLSLSTKQTISKVVRPTLEATGLMGGGAIGLAAGGPFAPATGAAGGILGYTGMSGLADRVDEMLGLKGRSETLQEGFKETEAGLKRGAMLELGGQLLARGVSPQIIDKVLAPLAGVVGRVQSGVRATAGERLFKDPGAIFAGAREKAGAALGKTRKALGFEDTRAISEKVKALGDKGMSEAVETLSKIEQGAEVGAQEIIRGMQAFARKIEATPFVQRSERAILGDARQQFTDALMKFKGAGTEREAAKKFARAATADEFTHILPVTKAGDVSVGRATFLPAMMARGFSPEDIVKAVGIVAAQSPLLAGIEIATAGGLAKAGQVIFGNPSLRRAVLSILSSGVDNANR